MQLVANLSMMFSDLPLVERLQAAADAGFDVVEIQFPYTVPLADLVTAQNRAGVTIALINLPPGDLEAGDVGLTCLADRKPEFHTAVETALTYATALGVRRINALAGRPPPDAWEKATATLIENLTYVADRFTAIDATVLLEPVNPTDVPGYLINALEPALAVLGQVNRDNAKLLFDLYHMVQTEPSLPDAVARAGHLIGHVQFADHPGRHEPGTGKIDFNIAFRALKSLGYTGYAAAEYWPQGPTTDGLGWRKDFEQWGQSD